LRVVDLINPPRFEAVLRQKVRENNEVLKAYGAKPLSFAKVHAAYREAGDYLRPFVANTVILLHEATQRKARILFEGAQGTFLDLDHGTYPFVTSSNTTAGGACTGSGVSPSGGGDESLHHASGRRAFADRERGDCGHVACHGAGIRGDDRARAALRMV
jgi:adenylosuccinate synthase